MKKVYISIAALLLCGQMTFAQAPANRTASTVAADVLAQMPAAEQERYNKTEESIIALFDEKSSWSVLEIAQELNKNNETIKKNVQNLVKKDILEKQGSTKGTYYILKKQ